MDRLNIELQCQSVYIKFRISSKIQQKFIKTHKKLIKISCKNVMHKVQQLVSKFANLLGGFNLPLKLVADTYFDCWKKLVSSKIILREKFIQETNALNLSENIAVFYLHWFESIRMVGANAYFVAKKWICNDTLVFIGFCLLFSFHFYHQLL